MASIASHEEFRIGRVVEVALGSMRRNLPAFAGLTLLLSGVPNGALYAAFGGVPGADGFAMGWAVAAAWLVSMVSGALLQAAMIRMAITDLNGARSTVGEALGTAFQLVLPVIALTVIVIVSTAFGAMLLLVPGIIIYVMWSVAVPVLVEERAGIGGSLSRSRALTKGSRWPLFGLLAISIIALMAVQAGAGFVAGLALGAAGGTLTVTLVAINLITSMIFSMFISTTVSVTYLELRRTKEGVRVDQLAEVFA